MGVHGHHGGPAALSAGRAGAAAAAAAAAVQPSAAAPRGRQAAAPRLGPRRPWRNPLPAQERGAEDGGAGHGELPLQGSAGLCGRCGGSGVVRGSCGVGRGADGAEAAVFDVPPQPPPVPVTCRRQGSVSAFLGGARGLSSHSTGCHRCPSTKRSLPCHRQQGQSRFIACRECAAPAQPS